MPQVEFKYCALHYLNTWLIGDRLRCAEMVSENKALKLAALGKFAYEYRIARNLPKKYDVGKRLRRYQPLLKIMESVKRDEFSGSNLVPSIRDVERRISEQYGFRGVLSATTKFLWLMIKSPIIIYDGRAQAALRTKDGDLEEYYSAWREKYRSVASKIDSACQSLIGVRDYMSDKKVATQKYVDDVTSKRWFKQRVFDLYLWHAGVK